MDNKSQKKSIEAATGSELILQNIIDFLPARIFWKDVNLKYLGCNMAFAKDAGKSSPQELIGKDDYDLAWKGQAESYRADDKKVIETGIAKADYEEPQTTPTGVTIWVTTSKVPLRDSSGKIIGMLGTYSDVTKRRVAEDVLRESEYFFKESQSAALIGSYKLNVISGNWISSAVLDRIFGINNSYEKNIHGWLELIYPDDREMTEKYLNINILSNHEVFNKEFRIVRKFDNQIRWVHALGKLFFDEKGNAISMMGTVQDITTQKQIQIDLQQKNLALEKSAKEMANTQSAMLNILADERSLQEDEKKFKLAIDSTSDHIIMTNAEGIVIYANKAAEQLTGFSFEEMKDKTPRLWGRQMPQEVYVSMWDTIKNKKQPYEGELINKNKKGELYPVQARISPVLDPTGKVLFFVGNERDISSDKKLADELKKENEQIEKQVKERTKELYEKNIALVSAKEEISKGWFEVQTEKARLLASVASIPLGFIMFDHEGKLLLKNTAFEETLGIDSYYSDLDSIDGFLGKDFSVKTHYINCMSDKKTIDLKEISYNGKYFHVLFAPVLTSYNKLASLGVIVLIQDVTEAKISERSKDEFFSIASHELRTPLTAIRGNTSLIRQYYGSKIKDDKELSEMIDDIHASSLRLINIVNDFLNVSRLEQGKMIFKKELINLVEVTQDVIKEYQVTGLLKNLYLKFDPPSVNVPKVVADYDKIRQVITNLIGNSIKYTKDGGITVNIEPQEGFVKLLVSDTGRGIEKNQQNLLFRKFVQTQQSILTRDTTQGTGLGLYISKLMVEGMNGKIQLEKSEPNVGSVFSFSVPVSDN